MRPAVIGDLVPVLDHGRAFFRPAFDGEAGDEPRRMDVARLEEGEDAARGQGRSVIKVTDDPAAVDFEAVHRFLDQESHWAQGIPRATLERALRHSLCFSAPVFFHAVRWYFGI